MSAQRPILVLTASTGSGHNMAAEAMAAALRRQNPPAPVEIVDVLNSAGPLFRRIYGGGYAALVNRLPWGMGWLYETTDQANHDVRERLMRAVQNQLTRGIVRDLLRRAPSLVVNTHYLPADIVAMLRNDGQLDCPQVTVTTDLETHRIWVHSPTERYYTATELGRTFLTTWGVAADRILVTGIPIRPQFEQDVSRADARARLNLPPNGLIVLLVVGTVGYGTPEGLLAQLLSVPSDVHVVGIAGRSPKLKERFERTVRKSSRSATIVGFSDEMHLWMRAADLMVTKSGGLTSSEALRCGLPLAIVNAIPGQETRNADYLLEHGAAIKVNHAQLLGARVAEVLSEPGRLEQMRTSAGRLAQPNAADRIAQDALSFLTPASI